MATMLKVKLGVLILAVGAVVVVVGTGTGNSSLCNYHYSILTGLEVGAGTDAYVLVGLQDRDGQGWRHSFSGKHKDFERGGLLDFKTTSARECINPCHLTLSISGGSSGSAWYPLWVRISVYDEGADMGNIDYAKYVLDFIVKDWVYEGYPIERRVGLCIYKTADSSSIV